MWIEPSRFLGEPRQGVEPRQRCGPFSRRALGRVALAVGILLAACGETKNVGEVGYIKGFVGGVAADEPRAAIVGRDILSRGGSAADAATAMFFTLAVTKPSSAGIGAVGACLYFDGANARFSAFDFAPHVGGPLTAGRIAIAPPSAVRGMAALHARHGRLPWAELVGPAEALARFGHSVSRSLAADLAVAEPELMRDPGMRRVFGRPDGRIAGEGDQVQQLELAASLAQIRQRGAGAMHAGPLAAAFVESVTALGGDLTIETLRETKPRALDPIVRRAGDHRMAFMPTLTSNGPQQARLWRLLGENSELEDAPRDERLHVIAEATVLAHSEYARLARAPAADLDTFDDVEVERLDERFRAFDPDRARPLAQWLDGVQPVPSEVSGTSVVAVDPQGGAAACGFTLNRSFGIGRLLPGVGAAAALRLPPGIVSSAIAPIVVGNLNTGNFHLAMGGSGAGAATAMVTIAARTLLGGESINAAVGSPRFSRGGGDATVFVEEDVGQEARAALTARGYDVQPSEPIARINAGYCARGLPRYQETCDIRTDWRGHGLAASAR